MPLSIFRSSAFTAAVLAAAAMTFGMYAMLFLMPLYLQTVRGASAPAVGLQMLPLSLAFFLVSLKSGALAARFGARVVMTSGLALMGLGFLILSTLSRGIDIVLIEFAFLQIGIGLGLNTGAVAFGWSGRSAEAQRGGCRGHRQYGSNGGGDPGSRRARRFLCRARRAKSHRCAADRRGSAPRACRRRRQRVFGGIAGMAMDPGQCAALPHAALKSVLEHSDAGGSIRWPSHAQSRDGRASKSCMWQRRATFMRRGEPRLACDAAKRAKTLAGSFHPSSTSRHDTLFKASIAEPEIQAGANDAQITDRVDIAKSQVFNAHRHGLA